MTHPNETESRESLALHAGLAASIVTVVIASISAIFWIGINAKQISVNTAEIAELKVDCVRMEAHRDIQARVRTLEEMTQKEKDNHRALYELVGRLEGMLQDGRPGVAWPKR